MKLEEIASKRKEKTLNARLDVAKMLGEVGRHREMIKMLDEIHVALIMEHGMYHEGCLQVRFMTGKALEALGRPEESLNAVNEVLDQLLAERERYGVKMLGLHLEIAELLKKLGKESESRDVLNRVESILKAEQALGSLDVQMEVVELFERLGKIEESYKTMEHFYFSVLHGGEKEHIKHHMIRMYELAKVLQKTGRYEEALGRYRAVDLLTSSKNGEFHWTTLELKIGIGICQEKLGKEEESEKILSEVLYNLKFETEVIDEEMWQENRHYAWLLEKMGELEDAYGLLVRGHQYMLCLLGPEDNLTLEAKKDMADMLVRMGRFEEALVIFEKIYYIRKKLEEVELEDVEPPKQKGRCVIS